MKDWFLKDHSYRRVLLDQDRYDVLLEETELLRGNHNLIPNLFNIGEINFFGLPIVLNPFLIVPFILVPIVTYTIGYLATAAGLCPIFYLDVPWTMPGIIIGFISSGLKVSSIFWQALVIVLSVLIYMPFVKMWEKAQAKEEQERLAESQETNV